MQIGNKGLELIKSFEGCILTSYDDSNERIVHEGQPCYGTLTIGWGSTRNDIPNLYKGMTLSQQEADDIFLRSLQRYVNEVNALGREWNQNQFDALVSFHYNTGSVETLCRNRCNSEIAEAMLLYTHSNGQVMQGLIRRRNAERDLFLNGNVDSTPISINNAEGKIAELQNILHVTVDNIWGPQTWGAVQGVLAGVPYKTPLITKWIQLRLGCEPDGIFGDETCAAVREWQSSHGLAVDGIAGPETIRSLALA